jgi:hypothetical protein
VVDVIVNFERKGLTGRLGLGVTCILPSSGATISAIEYNTPIPLGVSTRAAVPAGANKIARITSYSMR